LLAPVELRCECGGASCAAVIHVDPGWFNAIRKNEHQFCCAYKHDHANIEQVLRPLTDTAKQDYIVVMAPEWGAPVDADALEVALVASRGETDTRRAALDSTLTRITGLASTGALIVGLLAVFAPDKTKSLSIVWIAPGILIICWLVWWSLYVPAKIRAARRSLFNAMQQTLQERVRFAQALYTTEQRKVDPTWAVRAVGATYAMLERRYAAEAVALLGWERLLPKEDVLVGALPAGPRQGQLVRTPKSS
jgi:hypothetical protein